MTLAQENFDSQKATPEESSNNTSDAVTIEKIQQNEATTFLQPAFAPKMMSLAKFLEPFDKSGLTNEDAAQKYSVYVAGFLKEQLSDHFERHKNSAW